MRPAAPNREFKIHGMDCAEEVAILKQAIGPLVGGEEHLAFDILNGKMIVLPTAAAVTPGQIEKAVERVGMRPEPWREGSGVTSTDMPWERRRRVVLTAAGGSLVATGLLLHASIAGGFQTAFGAEGLGVAHEVPLAAQTAYLLAILTGAWYVLPKAWYAVRRLRPDMNLLMIVAVFGAIGIGEWFEGATVSFLFALSLTLEAWSVGRARRAVAALMELTPPIALLLDTNGQTLELPSESVPVGSVLLVKPGEKIPLDGTVLRGRSEVNQAPITGESMPVAKEPGAAVFSGTINGDGALEIQTTKPAGDTTLAHIIRMVGEASSKRAPTEQWVERFARIYTPSVLLLAIAIVLLPPLALGGEWRVWFYRSLVLLVIGCPCALVISTPVTIVAALAAAARNGVLLKGGAFVEAPGQLKAVALDKTGTLTAGKPAVTGLVPLEGHSAQELLERVAGMESQSDHPLARAIVEYATQQRVTPLPVESFQIIQGKGATARVDGKTYWIGSHRYLEERGQETPKIHERLEQLMQAGQSVVVVGNDTHVCGFISIADAIRPEARQAVQALREAGIAHVVMLTGDNRGTAAAIAQATGIDEFRAELLPADKVAAIESLVSTYRTVAMVGDGVNDAPAMARATVGIAMGAAGSDAAIETADIALMADDLGKLSWLIRHSLRALAIIRQNIVLSLAVKALFLVLTFAGRASLWAAIAADMGVSLLVIVNALRLLRTRSEA